MIIPRDRGTAPEACRPPSLGHSEAVGEALLQHGWWEPATLWYPVSSTCVPKLTLSIHYTCLCTHTHTHTQSTVKTGWWITSIISRSGRGRSKANVQLCGTRNRMYVIWFIWDLLCFSHLHLESCCYKIVYFDKYINVFYNLIQLSLSLPYYI